MTTRPWPETRCRPSVAAARSEREPASELHLARVGLAGDKTPSLIGNSGKIPVASRATLYQGRTDAASCYIRRIEYMATPLVDLEATLKALGDRTRLRILGLLLGGEVCVCDIHETLAIAQPKASRHLASLRRAGLVETRRQGLWVHYRLADLSDARLSSVADSVRQALSQLDAVQRDASRLRARGSSCTVAPLTLSPFIPAGVPVRGRLTSKR